MRENTPPHILRLAFDSIGFRENILSYIKRFSVTLLGGLENVSLNKCHSSQKFPLQQQL